MELERLVRRRVPLVRRPVVLERWWDFDLDRFRFRFGLMRYWISISIWTDAILISILQILCVEEVLIWTRA